MQQVRLKQLTKAKKAIEAFKGYDHRPVIQDGCWYDEENLSSDQYPLLSVRKNRAQQIVPWADEEGPAPVDAGIWDALGKEDLVLLGRDGVLWSGGYRLPLIGGSYTVTATVSMAGIPTPVSPDEAQMLSKLKLEAPAVTCYTSDSGWDDGYFPGRYEFVYLDDRDTVPADRKNRWYSERTGNCYTTAELGLSISPFHLQELVADITCTPEELSEDPTMVSMGAWVAIWPWKVYVNAVKLAAGDAMVYGTDYGGMENHWRMDANDAEGGVQPANLLRYKLSLCDINGVEYQNVVVGASEPQSKSSTWVEVTENSISVRVYSEATVSWNVIPTTYVKISADDIGVGLKKWDGVSISAQLPNYYAAHRSHYTWEFLNSSHIIQALDEDWIVVIGIFEPGTQAEQNQSMTDLGTTWTYEAGAETIVMKSYTVPGSAIVLSPWLAVDRNLPQLDFVVESGNRLWGCFYGEQDGEILNEIYASALGDFKNWNVFQGLSTDSWVASRGADGPYTGASVLDGHPLFFRENSVEKVFPSSSGAHQIQTQTLEGVQKGSGRSTVVIDDRLYYKGVGGVYVYTGTLPALISPQFGEVKYGKAGAGRHGKKYYINMQRSDGTWVLACYDTLAGVWHMENAPGQVDLLSWKGSLYYISDGLRYAVDGGSDCGGVSWYAESGVLGLDVQTRKYISKISLRYKRELGSAVRVYIQYDESGHWLLKESLAGTRLYAGTLSIWPRRCDTFRIKLEGVGGFTLYSISWERERGSDV